MKDKRQGNLEKIAELEAAFGVIEREIIISNRLIFRNNAQIQNRLEIINERIRNENSELDERIKWLSIDHQETT